MAALKELQDIEKISQAHLLRVRYAIHRYWELTTTEQVVVNTIVDRGEVKELENDLEAIFQRLHKKKVSWN